MHVLELCSALAFAREQVRICHISIFCNFLQYSGGVKSTYI